MELIGKKLKQQAFCLGLNVEVAMFGVKGVGG